MSKHIAWVYRINPYTPEQRERWEKDFLEDHVHDIIKQRICHGGGASPEDGLEWYLYCNKTKAHRIKAAMDIKWQANGKIVNLKEELDEYEQRA